MKRRDFIRGSTLTSATVAGALATPALGQTVRRLTLVTSWGRNLVGVFEAAQRIADTISVMSGGTLTVEVKAAGEQIGAFEVLDAVSSGQADLYHSADYYFVNRNPAFAFFTGVPFGMTADEMNTWYYHGGGMSRHHALGEMFNIRSYLAGNTGAQAGGWFRTPINELEDFRDLRFRMTGLGGRALSLLGAKVQNLPGADVYPALEAGTLDGTEWIGPWADEIAGFQNLTPHYYPAGFHEPCAALSLGINLPLWSALTEQEQRIIEAAAAETNLWSLSQYRMNNGLALQRLISAGVTMHRFPDAVWSAMGQASREVIEGYFGDPMFAEIAQSYYTAMTSTAGWLSVSSDVYRSERERLLESMGR